jgi:hypothetical protein
LGILATTLTLILLTLLSLLLALLLLLLRLLLQLRRVVCASKASILVMLLLLLRLRTRIIATTIWTISALLRLLLLLLRLVWIRLSSTAISNSSVVHWKLVHKRRLMTTISRVSAKCACSDTRSLTNTKLAGIIREVRSVHISQISRVQTIASHIVRLLLLLLTRKLLLLLKSSLMWELSQWVSIRCSRQMTVDRTVIGLTCSRLSLILSIAVTTRLNRGSDTKRCCLLLQMTQTCNRLTTNIR